MNLKTYRANTMAQALAAVKQDLGQDAVILHTRSYKQGGLLGLGAKQVVEITAGRGAEVGRVRTEQQRRQRAAAVRKSSKAAPAAGRGLEALPARRPAPPPAKPARAAEPQQPPLAGDLIRRTYAAAKAELSQQEQAQPARSVQQPAATPPRKQVRRQKAPTVPVPAPVAVAPAAAPAAPPAPVAPADGQLAEEMRFVREMMGRMMRSQSKRAAKGQFTPQLFEQYMNLLKHEVADELADEIVTQVRARLSADEMEDEQKVREAVRTMVGRYLPIDDSAQKLAPTADGRPRTIALIGPTGVGKTTTIAKLAATFKLKHKKNVALITIDTYRIAAVEQLRTYANIIKIPLHVVVTPEEMTAALRKCAACDVIMIDTAGRSQRDDPKLDQLAGFLRAARPHETHLVLSSTASQAVMLEIIRKFSRLRADRIIFTKLDEAVNFGVLLNVTRRVKKQLSFVTTGQEVPHQIEPSRPERLAALVMGDGGL